MVGIAQLLLVLTALAAAAEAAVVSGLIVDATAGRPLAAARIAVAVAVDAPPESRSMSDSAGAFAIATLDSGICYLRVEALGYESVIHKLVLPAATDITIALKAQPLLMDEAVVRARRPRAQEYTAAFVQEIPVKEQGPGATVPSLLQKATGVRIRRYGGLGSFSTVSIRGSSAEQVQVYLDGVSLNSALGGAVDLGSLPLGGVESLEVYRGAVPARFGGNSMGGVLHIRTRNPGTSNALRVQGTAGSLATRQATASMERSHGDLRLLGLAAYAESRNDFRFRDDNGTEYNAADDVWSKRKNSNFRSFRALAKGITPFAGQHLKLHHIFDLKRQGIPGIGNNQSLKTRFAAGRNTTELQLYGAPQPVFGYRMGVYHTRDRSEYQDPRGEVGVGSQHDRTTNTTLGARAEANVLLRSWSMLTLVADSRHQHYEPEDLLRSESRLLDSSRKSLEFGGEAELPLARQRLILLLGGQMGWLDDAIGSESSDEPSSTQRDHTRWIWGRHLGARLHLGSSWSLLASGGHSQRAPSFFELFGDRGAVRGNTELASEAQDSFDLGLTYRALEPPDVGIALVELAVYRKAVTDLIRFVNNSQKVSQPHNIGKANIGGLETRFYAGVSTMFTLGASYQYQRAENRSPFAYERGNDLPNAPRHAFQAELSYADTRYSATYETVRESRHYLDRANLRPVRSRSVHTVRAGRRFGPAIGLEFEIRNLTDNQVADLWGYPLPGRSYFASVRHQR